MMDTIERTQRMSKQLVTVDTFEKMLTRRGYQWSLLTTTDIQSEQAGLLWYYVQRKSGGEGWKIDFNAFAVYRSLLEVEREIDTFLANGQHHVLHQCGCPLLQSVEGTVTRFYVYRSVEAGPDSASFTRCPQCGEVLDIPTMREIED